MNIESHDIKALQLELRRFLDDAEYLCRHLNGKWKAKHLIEQDMRQLRDLLRRLSRHIDRLHNLPHDGPPGRHHSAAVNNQGLPE